MQESADEEEALRPGLELHTRVVIGGVALAGFSLLASYLALVTLPIAFVLLALATWFGQRWWHEETRRGTPSRTGIVAFAVALLSTSALASAFAVVDYPAFFVWFFRVLAAAVCCVLIADAIRLCLQSSASGRFVLLGLTVIGLAVVPLAWLTL